MKEWKDERTFLGVGQRRLYVLAPGDRRQLLQQIACNVRNTLGGVDEWNALTPTEQFNAAAEAHTGLLKQLANGVKGICVKPKSRCMLKSRV